MPSWQGMLAKMCWIEGYYLAMRMRMMTFKRKQIIMRVENKQIQARYLVVALLPVMVILQRDEIRTSTYVPHVRKRADRGKILTCLLTCGRYRPCISIASRVYALPPLWIGHLVGGCVCEVGEAITCAHVVSTTKVCSGPPAKSLRGPSSGTYRSQASGSS